jgi:hypothetical protein
MRDRIRRLVRALGQEVTASRVLTLAVLVTVSTMLWGGNPVVIGWLLLAEVGIFLAHQNGKESLADYHSLGGHVNGRRTIAIGNLRREIVRGLIALDFVIIGALILLGVSGVLVPGLYLASAGMALNSYLDRRDRLYLTANGIQARDEQGRFTSEK